MSDKLQGQMALITGGSRGIGLAIAKAYLQEGASVCICGRNKEALENATKELSAFGPIVGIPCDVAIFCEVQEMVSRVMSQFGRIDILVNNAGISMTYGRVGESDPSTWANVIAVNLIGTFHCCHAVIPHMQKQGGGQIINLKGYGAHFPSPYVTAYGASKAALVAFTKSLAREYKRDHIHVNIFSPGIVKTDLITHVDTTADGKAHLHKIGWVIDAMAGPVEYAALFAVKMALLGKKVTGKSLYAVSARRLLFRVLRYGMTRLWQKK
jgi:NAD(P)-dependent dehydrogenase (short-subunit alcohol dehydrogenase family)